MSDKPLSWPDLATTLFDKLTGRGAEIRYDFVNLEVFVPSEHSEDSPLARWKLNGTMKITGRMINHAQFFTLRNAGRASHSHALHRRGGAA